MTGNICGQWVTAEEVPCFQGWQGPLEVIWCLPQPPGRAVLGPSRFRGGRVRLFLRVFLERSTQDLFAFLISMFQSIRVRKFFLALNLNFHYYPFYS